MRFTSPRCVLPLTVAVCVMPSRNLLFVRDLHPLTPDIKPNNLRDTARDDKGVLQVIAINMSLVCAWKPLPYSSTVLIKEWRCRILMPWVPEGVVPGPRHTVAEKRGWDCPIPANAAPKPKPVSPACSGTNHFLFFFSAPFLRWPLPI